MKIYMWLVLLTGLLSLLGITSSSTAATPPTMGKLEVRVTDHRAGIEDFLRLDVAIGEVRLHKKSKARSKGWLPVLLGAKEVDIVPLKDGRFVRLGEAAVAAGRFNAVRVAFASVSGQLKKGGNAPVVATGSTLRVPLVIEPGSRHTMLIDLTAEDQTEHPNGTYVVKVRRIEFGK